MLNYFTINYKGLIHNLPTLKKNILLPFFGRKLPFLPFSSWSFEAAKEHVKFFLNSYNNWIMQISSIIDILWSKRSFSFSLKALSVFNSKTDAQTHSHQWVWDFYFLIRGTKFAIPFQNSTMSPPPPDNQKSLSEI